MPIPNELFTPGVIATSLQCEQLRHWLGGRPVPTEDELIKDFPDRSRRVDLPRLVRVVPLDPNRKLFYEEPRAKAPADPKPSAIERAGVAPTARPRFTIAAPKTVAPPPRRR